MTDLDQPSTPNMPPDNPADSSATSRGGPIARRVLNVARDLLVVTAGVLLALAGDAWLGRRTARDGEEALLLSMRSSLITDLTALRRSVEGWERIEAACVFLEEYLAAGHQYADSLDEYFGRVYQQGPSTAVDGGAYQTLMSRGLDLVSNQELRLQIVSAYDGTFATVDSQNELNINVLFEVLRPYYLANFRDLSFGRSATPLDFEQLRSDQDYRNILAYRAEFARRTMITFYERAADDAEALIEALDTHLAGL